MARAALFEAVLLAAAEVEEEAGEVALEEPEPLLLLATEKKREISLMDA